MISLHMQSHKVDINELSYKIEIELQIAENKPTVTRGKGGGDQEG